MKHIHLRAKDASSRPITLEPDKSLGEAHTAMQSCGVSRLVVVATREYRPVGIITEKDIVRLLDTYGSRTRLDKIRLEQVMSKNLVMAFEESGLSSCARLMLGNGISSIIITNDKGLLKGICTKINVASAYARHCAGEHLVGDFMTKKVFAVMPDETLEQILLLMVNNNVSRVVVTKNQKPVGIVTEHDVMPLSTLVDPYFNRFVTNAAEIKDFRPGQTQVTVPSAIKSIFVARDLMKGDPIMITKDSDLADAAKMMIGNGMGGLPVVDSTDGDLVGIVTKTDVTRALACTVGDTTH